MKGGRERPAAAPSLPFPAALLRTVFPLAALNACGGGLPLLHPARTLPNGDVTASAGFSSNIAVGALSSAVQSAGSDSTATRAVPAPPDLTYAKGALIEASVGPGLAPLVGARAGLGEQFEAGLAYTGRAVRVDVRRSFDLSSHWALSLGAAGSSILDERSVGGALPGIDLSQLHGWGADIPVLVGYMSDDDLYMLWIGARTGWEHVDVAGGTLSATRFWGGGLFGLAVGFRHVHVAMELDVSWAGIAGDYNATHAQISGLTLAPAASAWWRF